MRCVQARLQHSVSETSKGVESVLRVFVCCVLCVRVCRWVWVRVSAGVCVCVCVWCVCLARFDCIAQ